MGPLKGYKVIELAGIGPAPFCGMMLADMGAEVIRVERESEPIDEKPLECDRRGKRSIKLNLKSADGVRALLKLVENVDIFIEGFRPGVMEKLGIGPEECLQRNPALVFGRMTGWGQDGPLARAAGHDLNYIALTGALSAIGRKDENPVPPLNLVGDFGGGAMFLAFGVVCALLESKSSGQGQVVDAAMTDGSALSMSMVHSLHAQGLWSPERGQNILDTGAHFYEVYETLDNRFISIASIEPQFYHLLIEKMGLDEDLFSDPVNSKKWPELKAKLQAEFKTRTAEDWCHLLEGTDVCFAPVLNFLEAQNHPHNKARKTYIEVGGMMQPAPAPRFSRSETDIPCAAKPKGIDTAAIIAQYGLNSCSEKVTI